MDAAFVAQEVHVPVGDLRRHEGVVIDMEARELGVMLR